MKYITGLVVGKFCPLHIGHEFVIKTALRQCEKVIIISYTSEDYGYSSTVRENWLRGLDVDQSRLDIHVIDHLVWMNDSAPDSVHRHFCAEYLVDTLETTVQAVFTSESYGAGFADYLSRYFTQTFINRPIVVDHVMVDYDRQTYPISGTELREKLSKDDFSKLRFLPVTVRKSFIRKVLFLGGESTGKTTISETVANLLCYEVVREYGRQLYEERNGNLVFEDLVRIGQTQCELEKLAARYAVSGDYLICDTSPLTTMFYSLEWFGTVARKLDDLAWDTTTTYSKIYLCAPDFPMVQDGTRQDETFRKKGHDFYVDYLNARGIKYTLLTGSLHEKINKVIADLTPVVVQETT